MMNLIKFIYGTDAGVTKSRPYDKADDVRRILKFLFPNGFVQRKKDGTPAIMTERGERTDINDLVDEIVSIIGPLN